MSKTVGGAHLKSWLQCAYDTSFIQRMTVHMTTKNPGSQWMKAENPVAKEGFHPCEAKATAAHNMLLLLRPLLKVRDNK